MADYRLSGAADADLDGILVASAERWGFDRAAAYLLDLEEAFVMLPAFPAAGREAADLRPGLRRLERGEHVIFYRREGDDILVVRVLHRRMLPPGRL